jgi:glycosyltransferase involved in cell wall biosynthesis
MNTKEKIKKLFFSEKLIIKLLWNKNEPTGGASIQSLVWMKSLNELGYKIYLGRLKEDLKEIKPEYSWINFIPLYDSSKKYFLKWFTYRFPLVFKAISKFEGKFVYISMPTWHTFYFGLICKLLKKKHIIRIASDVNVDHRLRINHGYLGSFQIILAYRIASLILAQNEYQFQILKKRLPNQNIIKIPNPIVIDRAYESTKDQMTGYIAWVGNFRRVKNLGLLYEIAKNLPQEQFKIAGVPMESIDEETKSSIADLEKLTNVEFCGNIHRQEILSFYTKSKFLLNTSDYEGFSNTFLESMVTGTPILSTINVNPDGIISEFNLGIIYSSVSNLKERLVELTESSYLDYSKNCLNYVKENHDHLNLGKKLVDVIEKL